MKILIAVAALSVCASAADAAARKGIKFWNLTGETLAEVMLAPVGTTAFGPNQCLNDKDGTVDFDEDVAVKGVAPGRYDIRMKDVKGRTCFARDIDVKADATFSVGEKQLVDCAK